MNNSKSVQRNNSVQSWILWGIPVIFIVGSLIHFVYDWSGNSTIVALFAPVNESVWEHLKMSFWPMLAWWIAGYLVLRNTNHFSVLNWFCAGSLALVISPLVIVSFFYTYTSALGIESFLLDILSFILGITIGQLVALHVYKYGKPKPCCLFVAIAIIMLLAIAFIVFTFAPPHIPLFQDPLTGGYGI